MITRQNPLSCSSAVQLSSSVTRVRGLRRRGIGWCLSGVRVREVVKGLAHTHHDAGILAAARCSLAAVQLDPVWIFECIGSWLELRVCHAGSNGPVLGQRCKGSSFDSRLWVTSGFLSSKGDAPQTNQAVMVNQAAHSIPSNCPLEPPKRRVTTASTTLALLQL